MAGRVEEGWRRGIDEGWRRGGRKNCSRFAYESFCLRVVSPTVTSPTS